MNKMLIGLVALASIGIMPVHADIAFEVKDVEAHQRYPWNEKVDIDFTIDSAVEGSNFTVSVSAEDTVGKTNVVLSTVRYDDKIPLSRLGKIAAGRHRLTWDGDADVPDTVIPSLAFSVSAWAGETVFPDPELYMVVELSGVTSAGQYSVSYLPSVPKGGWTDEYKTTKLVLRKIPGKQFYAGVFEVTQKQWDLVMGGRPGAVFTTDGTTSTCNTLGGIFPISVTSGEAVTFMRRVSGQFRLPTWDEWFFVCDANARIAHQGMLNMGVAGWTRENSEEKVHPVGMKYPNAWGIYDMYGNARELVTRVDTNRGNSYTSRHAVGGSFRSRAANCRICFGSAQKDDPTSDSTTKACSYIPESSTAVGGCGATSSSHAYEWIGFRVFCDLP